MSPDLVELKEGAIFVGDAHYSSNHPELLDFLKAVAAGTIPTPQLVLMGDMFDQLFGGIEYTVDRNREAVEALKKIAAAIEVIYLEGNHDFQLRSVFENIRVFPIQEQPVLCHYQGAEMLLAHGDLGMGIGYRIYTALIRNKTILKLLRWIDNRTGHAIVHWVDSHNGKKDNCNGFSNFRTYTEARLRRVKVRHVDYLIDGHFHQNSSFDLLGIRYINLAAFACNQRYFELKSLHNQPLLQEAQFGKE